MGMFRYTSTYMWCATPRCLLLFKAMLIILFLTILCILCGSHSVGVKVRPGGVIKMQSTDALVDKIHKSLTWKFFSDMI